MFAVIIEEPKKIKKENKVNHETVEIIFSFFSFFSRSQKISFNFIYTHYLVSFYKKKKKKCFCWWLITIKSSVCYVLLIRFLIHVFHH